MVLVPAAAAVAAAAVAAAAGDWSEIAPADLHLTTFLTHVFSGLQMNAMACREVYSDARLKRCFPFMKICNVLSRKTL